MNLKFILLSYKHEIILMDCSKGAKSVFLRLETFLAKFAENFESAYALENSL